MSDLTGLTLAGARDRLARGEISSRELTEAHVAAVEAARPLNAFITETPERALEMAAASDARRAKGEAGALEGLPIAVKDLYCTEGVRTTAGVAHPRELRAALRIDGDRAKLWRVGAVMLGKTNMDEFAMGSSNMFSFAGPAINPVARAQGRRQTDGSRRLVGRLGGGGGRARRPGRHRHRHRRLDPPAGVVLRYSSA